MSTEQPSPDARRRTIAFYDANAADFAERTCGIDMSDLYEPFLALVPEGGDILDAGYGPAASTRPGSTRWPFETLDRPCAAARLEWR